MRRSSRRRCSRARTGRANRAGLKLTARQIFEHQTIAGLAAVAGTAATAEAEQGLIAGEVALTPIQHWFFAQDLAEPHHFNQASQWEGRRPLQPALLAEALRHLLAHHDALRLRFRRPDSGWRQAHADWDGAVAFEHIDLSELEAAAQPAALTQHADRLQASLDLAAGPLLRAALFDLGQEQRLLLISHHLVIDGVSWRILLEDLHAAYTALERGEAVRLAPKTVSFKHWAATLMAYAQSAEAQGERAYWQSIPWSQAPRLARDHDGINSAG